MASKKKWATKGDWADQKDTVIRLYKEKTLHEVMEIMERAHQFFST
jgi:hypothetical protein